jgi:hypothetical protein
MHSIRELAKKSSLEGGDVSLRALAQKYGTGTGSETIAAYLISDHHRRTGRAFGPLGATIGSVKKRPDGSYEQSYELGIAELGDIFQGQTRSITKVKAGVTLAAVKCFDTDDPSGTDEIFVIVSLINVNPNADRTDSLVFTNRMEITKVEEDNVFFEARTLGPETGTAFPGSGIRIHVAIFDHENGDADELRNKIQAFLDEAAKKAAGALAGAAAADDPQLAGAAGDVIDFEVGGVKPFKILTLGLADLITKLLADDLIGEHEFVVPTSVFVEWASSFDEATQSFPTWEASFRGSPDLPSRIRFNWPQKAEDEFMFSGGGGNYKVYFKITPIIVVEPLEPKNP